MNRIVSWASAIALAFTLFLAPQASAAPIQAPARTQITVLIDGGGELTTPNAHESRPSLSLSKLYLGYWVLYNGSEYDKSRVQHMITYSDDWIATELDQTYPQAIPEIVSKFGLGETWYSGYWGTSSTSSYDVARFLQSIRNDPVATPLLNGMTGVAPIAADGYAQNYGTGTLPGVYGTKYGWSDDRTINASASLGYGFIIVSNTYGSAETLTQDVQSVPLTTATSLLPSATATGVLPGLTSNIAV